MPPAPDAPTEAAGGTRQGLGDIRGGAVPVVLGCMAAQIGLGLVYVRGPLYKDIIAEFGWSRGLYSSGEVVSTLAIALASPVVGALTYRFGARPVLSLSIALMGVVYALFSRMQSYGELLALNAALGLAMAGVGDIAVGTVVSKWVAKFRGLALGIVYSGSNLAALVVAPAGAQILATSGWRAAFLMVGIAAVVLLLPAVLLAVREPPRGYAPPSGHPDGLLGGTAGDSDAGAAGAPLAEAARTREFWLLLGALFLFYFYYLGVLGHLVPFLTDTGLSNLRASMSLGISVSLGVVAKVGIGLIADRWPPRAALLLNFGAVVAASLLLLGIPSPGFLPLFVLVHGLAVAAQNVIYPLIVAHCFGVKHMAQIYGVLMLALLPGGVLGPMFAGFLFDWTGSYALAFRTFAVLNVLAFLGLLALRARPLALRPAARPGAV